MTLAAAYKDCKSRIEAESGESLSWFMRNRG